MRHCLFALALVGVSVIAPISPALTADLSRPTYKAPPSVYTPAPFSWTGFYVGGNLGWGWTDGDGEFSLGGVPGTYSGDGDGFLGGVQVGYNWQLNNWVFGVEADFQGSTGKGSVNGAAGATTFSGETKTPWFGTVRGRIGYAFDRSLVYVTGGAVYGKITMDGTLVPGGGFSSSETYWTWTAGAGYELMLWDRWSAKIEYLYVGTPSDFPLPPGSTSLDGDASSHIVRVGLNYHF